MEEWRVGTIPVMNELQEILVGGVVPATLYHYTSGEGLLGIVKGRSLRLSHTGFMNDRAETTAGLSIVKDETARVAKKWSDPHGRDGIGLERRLVKHLRHDSSYVACLSENPDSLDLWRGYATGVFAGFALGFSGTALAAVSEANPAGGLWRVDYDESAFRDRVGAALKAIQANPDLELGTAAKYLISLAACFKSAGWAAEREWRVVSTPCADSHVPREIDLDFRTAPFGLVPYFTAELSVSIEGPWDPPEMIAEIRLGSGAYVEERQRALEILRHRHYVALTGRPCPVSTLNMR
jgi:hypothetical protein